MMNHYSRRSTTHYSCRPQLESLETRDQPALLALSPVPNLVGMAPIAVLSHDVRELIDIETGPVANTRSGQGSASTLPTVLGQADASASHGSGESEAISASEGKTSLPHPPQGSNQVPPVVNNLIPQNAPTSLLSGSAASRATHLDDGPDKMPREEEKGDAAHDSRSESAEAWAVRHADGPVAESQHNSALERATPRREFNAFATSPNESCDGIAESHSLWSVRSDASEDTELIDRLVLITDVSAAVPDDGTLAVDAAMSLLTGGRRRAVVLPQERSEVASVATLIDDSSAAGHSSSEPTNERLTPLLLNPLTARPSTITTESVAIRPAERTTSAATAEVEKQSSVGVRMGTLLLLPLLGATALLAWIAHGLEKWEGRAVHTSLTRKRR